MKERNQFFIVYFVAVFAILADMCCFSVQLEEGKEEDIA